MVHKNKGIFEAPDRNTIPKCDVDVNNIEVLCQKSFDPFATRGLWDCCIGAKGEWEFPRVEESAILCHQNDVVLVVKTATPGEMV
jgi:hypothetical protein